MDEILYRKVFDLFYSEIEGGCASHMEAILESAIDNGELTEAEVADNEMAIAVLFDNHWFTCEVCNWTLPLCDMSEEEDAWRCTDCD